MSRQRTGIFSLKSSVGTMRKILLLKKGQRISIRYFEGDNPKDTKVKILTCEE
mgnify:CR=1 FL=1